MGLTICYRGTLRNPNDFKSMVEDVNDICLEIGWWHMPIHRSNIMPMQGVLIMPTDGDPIWLTFLLNGMLYNPEHFIYTLHAEKECIDEKKHQWIFTNTQHAGMDTHMAIIKFFRYLKMKYFDQFDLRDESQYWETDNELVCLIRFDEHKDDPDQYSGMISEDIRMYNLESAAELMDQLLLKRGGLGMSWN